jgi:hypothetical protein
MGDRSDMLNAYAQYAGDPAWFSKDVERYKTLQPADLQTAAQTWLAPAKRVVALVSVDTSAPRCGTLKGRK